MVKLKHPLFSLEARGGLAGTLAFDDRSGSPRVRKMPSIPNPQTLSQMYQRWLYQDYIAWWHDQTPAVKAQWESDARPYHMTGFAYWMRERLRLLPDIAGGWRLDELAGSVNQDFSRNTNHGIIYGASPACGVIGGARHFDGIDDRVNIPYSAVYDLPNALTIECFCTIHARISNDGIFGKEEAGGNVPFLIRFWGDNIRFGTLHDAAWFWTSPGFVPTLDIPYLVTGTFDESLPSENLKMFVDATLIGKLTHTDPLPVNTAVISVGKHGGNWSHTVIDHCLVYNRVLTTADMKRHSERRFPL